MDVISLGWAIWNFMQSPAGVGILLSLFAFEQALAQIPWIKANSTFQLLWNITAKLAGKGTQVVLALCLLAACNASETAKAKQILMTVSADAKTIVVTGCKDAPTAEVAANVVLGALPPGTTLDAVKVGAALAEPQINAICAQVVAAQTAAPKAP